ncbi:histone-lysine N-methyltransferase [Spatholobus suberectus]|nr:histone-lysine N-methyltransferase [Spatholobus suberectus]
MAPRRRPTKRGQTRMDAAIDAMAPYGFPNKLVRSTVQNLLKVYGGNDGWVFIEDTGYTLLIDTILEKQANPSPQHGLIEANPGDGPTEVTPAGCSNSALLPCSNTQTSDDTSSTDQAIDTVSAASGTGNQHPIKGVDTVSATSEIGREVPFKSVDFSSVTSEPGNQLFIKTEDIASAATETPIKADAISAEKESEGQPARNLSLGENHGPKSPQLVTRLSHKKRRPCHGWISSDDDEEELIELHPAPWSSISYARE